MYSTINEAMRIYKSIGPSNHYAIREEISGSIIAGTAAELYRAIIEADKAAGGRVSHIPTNPSDMEAWAIIEAAYNA